MTIYAWHFSNGTVGYGDGREIKPGMILACAADGIELCVRGFHASRNILDALDYAPGSVLSYVACEGRIIEADDKLVCSQRRHLAVVDVAPTLHEFACQCAENALALIDNPDPRSLAAIEAKRQWLRGEITDSELDAARAAAWDAARAAAWAAGNGNAAWAASAAYCAAGNSAWTAAKDAAWAAAEAAEDAAWAAAEAAEDAAWEAQEIKLLGMIMALPEFKLEVTS